MKKIKLFSLLVAMLFAGSAMAADPILPTTIYKVGDSSTLQETWASKNQTTNYFVSGDTVIFQPYVCYSSTKQTWLGCTGSGAASATWSATDCFKGAVAWFGETTSNHKYAGTRNDRAYLFNVTNCVSILFYGNPNDTKNNTRSIIANVYELGTDNKVAENSTIIKTATITGGTAAVGKIEGLDGKKSYQVQVLGNDGTNGQFYEIAFVAVPKSPTLSSFTINEVEAVIDDEAKTITAVLPYGTTIDWGSVAVVLGGTATKWSINDDHTQLTIGNAEGTPNVVYTLNITVAEPSHDATLSAITVDGEALEGFTSEQLTYGIELAYGTTLIPTVSAITTDEKATYTVKYVDAEGAETTFLPCSAIIEVTAEDGSTKQTYTIAFTVSTTASTDATLASITLDGVSIADFASATTKYTIELAYIADVPEIEATPTHAAATVVVDAPVLAKGKTGDATITVTAQDGKTIKVYTISFTRAAAEAAKLYEVIFSNEAKGAIDATAKTVTIPYLADTEEAVIPTTEEKNITVQGAGATVALNESNQIVMTSADDVETIFTIVGAPLVPKELGNETVTFDGTEKYFFAPAGYSYTKDKPYGWVANKNAETDKPRITTGLCRMYIALPACTSATLFTGTNERKAQLYVNGVNEGIVTFPKQNSYKIENLNATSANFIGIENVSGSEGGDLGFVNITLTGAKEVETSFEQAQVEAKAMKVIRDGQLLVIRDGKTYTAQGVQVQ